MLNKIWALMLFVGILFSVCTGKIGAVGNAALEGAGEAISLCMTMAGVMALWMGLMEIAKEAGVIGKMKRAVGPILRFLFPNLPPNHPAAEYIATNFVANVLGLGWACTPAGLRAMEELAKLEEERGTVGYATDVGGERVASEEMCTFLVMNISSLQLMPITMIAYRSKYGSAKPTAIVLPAIVATLVSTTVAFAYCKWKSKRQGMKG